MPDPAVALSRKTGLSEVLSAAVQRRAQPQALDTPKTAIETNPVYQIMLAPETDPEAKRDAVAAFLVAPASKEEARQRVRAYQAFEEFMQAERERMAQEIIRLTDTEAFSELQSVYRDFNNALIDFDDKMRPLTEILDAIYVLRTEGKTLDAFREIKDDRRNEEERARFELEKKRQLDALEHAVNHLTGDIAALGTKRSFLGGMIELAPSSSSRQEMARKQTELDSTCGDLARLADELAALEKQGPGASALGEFEAQKGKLRELLDISSEEHKQRQQDLVSSALNFVQTAKTRITSVRQHLGSMNGQIENLYDANAKMGGVYAILSDGIQKANQENQIIRAGLAPATDESLISRMTREERESAVDEHIGSLMAASAHTTETYADLTGQTIRIKTMRDSTQSQMDKARVMGTQGVAGVADRLSVVLQAVSAAALGESSTMAKDTLAAMVDSTNTIAQKETIRVAMGTSELNDDVVRAIEDLGTYGEVLRTSTNITRETMAEVQGNLAKIRDIAESVREDVRAAVGVAASIERAPPPITAPSSPFGVGR